MSNVSIGDICSRIPGLRYEGDCFWSSSGSGVVSYSSDGHEIIAAVEGGSFWFQHRNRIIVDVIGRHPPSGAVFDIGGGTGFVSQHLNRAGFLSAVIEPGAQGVETCRARGVPVIGAAFQDLEMPDGLLPAVAMFDVLEHIDDDIATLRSVWNSLEPGGKLYLTVPALMALWSEDDRDTGHFRRYTETTLLKKLLATNFNVLFGTYFFAPLILPLFMLKSLPSRLGLLRPVTKGAIRQEHSLPQNAVGEAFSAMLRREAARIAAGRRISLGTSYCLVAEKPTT